MRGGKKETKRLKEGRRAWLTGWSRRRTTEEYVCASLKDSNNERKTSQLTRQLCSMMERSKREEACCNGVVALDVSLRHTKTGRA